jgi:DNA-binding CsgD family transcriptional regulator
MESVTSSSNGDGRPPHISRRNRRTGTHIEVLRESGGWSLRCVDHGGNAGVPRWLDAQRAAADPTKWCAGCAAGEPAKQPIERRRRKAGPPPAWLSRAEKLRAEGNSNAAIARAVEEPPSRVYYWLNRSKRLSGSRRYYDANRERYRSGALERWETRKGEYRAEARKRGRDPRKRGRCSRCGQPMGWGQRSDGVCRRCRHQARLERQPTILRLWHQGATLREIAEVLDVTFEVVAKEVSMMREAGFDLPHRAQHGWRRSPLSEGEQETVVRMWEEGRSAEEIGREFALEAQAVRNLVARLRHRRGDVSYRVPRGAGPRANEYPG